MANNPPRPDSNYDPAGSTQMFRAFVDEGVPQRKTAPAASSGPRPGLIIGIVALIAITFTVALIALG